MPTPLRQRLTELASSFASDVLGALRSASLEDLLVLAPQSGRGDRRRTGARAGEDRVAGRPQRRGGRLQRRSEGDIAEMVQRIVALLRRHPDGMRAEEIREALGLEAKELPRPLKEGLESGQLGRSGQKRATTYVAKGSGSPARRAGSGGRKSGNRRRRGGRTEAAATGRGRTPRGKPAAAARARPAETSPPAEETPVDAPQPS